MIDSIKQLLQQEAQAVLNIPVTDAYEKAVQLIVEQIHQKKGKLVTSGMGKAGQIAMNIPTPARRVKSSNLPNLLTIWTRN